ncbi:transcriptional regulator NrdR [Lentilactobacillus laojiaonis]|uniref:transcriptional regulator NrdR n=1 Tax=Lentilactobacillus laojiaonis TaxID=2883998 RepID=UPI001D0B9BBD|nr:transcriptional regulator NrdR [Lentilactobacillus laojiaonis]UDM32585.1 transcriptional regulator NrdR [Lentilactobacillus laojiaonis]
MHCPHCNSSHLKVIDSRPTEDGKAIRRRRECENCEFRFTTFEKIEVTPLLVIKKNGNRESFDREKIVNGIIQAAQKRPVSRETIEKVVDHVENKIHSIDKKEISAKQIGEYVMEDLESVDEITYIRFASVYRQFKDMNVFFNELKEIMEKTNAKKLGESIDGK